MNIINVVLSGGVGSRLWPLSRKSRPKQYLNLFNGKSLFELTVDRNKQLTNKLIVVGNTDNCILSREELSKAGFTYVDIVEATPRNTAAAIAFASFAANKEEILLVTPSDHIIQDDVNYKVAVEAAINHAKSNAIVTFGIVPTKPETGFGYIEHNRETVISFREKPDHKTAELFVEKGTFLWNSGMFCFKAQVFLEELKLHAPEVYHAAKEAWEESENGQLDLELSLKIPSISVDYAVMEHSKNIKVIPSHFKWSDLGSFDAVYDYLLSINHPVDESGNMVIGTDNHTSFLGLKNTIFVHTNSAFLILNKANAQEVKNVYNELEKLNSPLLL